MNSSLLSLYLKMFYRTAIMLFVKQGSYNIDIYTLDGKQIETNQLNVNANERVYIALNATPGTYIMRVMEGSKCVKSIKLLKK